MSSIEFAEGQTVTANVAQASPKLQPREGFLLCSGQQAAASQGGGQPRVLKACGEPGFGPACCLSSAAPAPGPTTVVVVLLLLLPTPASFPIFKWVTVK